MDKLKEDAPDEEMLAEYLENPVYLAANELGDWTLINYQDNNHLSGFARAAFKNEQTGEIVFTFRGTEDDVKDHLLIPEDFFTDAQLALPGAPLIKPNQFKDAYDFVKQTIANQIGIDANNMTKEELSSYIQQSGSSFTGHSLGGGISQYLTYMTGGSAVTFNGVGIGQVLGITDFDQYDVTDYVIADDFIGNYGHH